MLVRYALYTILAVATVAATLIGTPVLQHNPAHAAGTFTACDNPHVLRRISKRFQILDANVLQAGLSIDEIFDIRENGFNFTPETEIQLIERRFCQGRAAMSDGKTRSIWFLIERGQGFASIGNNVEFCIAGLDPWRIYGAHCRSVR